MRRVLLALALLLAGPALAGAPAIPPGPPGLQIQNALSELAAAGSQATARANLGLGTMAVQNAATVAITGGTIAGVSSLSTTGAISVSPNMGGSAGVTNKVALFGNPGAANSIGWGVSANSLDGVVASGAAFNDYVGGAIVARRSAVGLGVPKLAAAPATAPGAGWTAIFATAGTNTGTCKLQVMAGTSTTPVTLVDNVGAGC